MVSTLWPYSHYDQCAHKNQRLEIENPQTPTLENMKEFLKNSEQDLIEDKLKKSEKMPNPD